MDVVVTGIGLVSALGNFETTWKRLLDGKSGIRYYQPFPALGSFPLALVDSVPIGLADLTQQVVATAVEDAELSLPLPDCGVVVGSSRGHQAQWEKLAAQLWQEKVVDSMETQGCRDTTVLAAIDSLQPPISLANWLDTLPHGAAIATARQIQSRGCVKAPMAACATGLWAIAQGYDLIKTGAYERVLVGAVEAPITPLTLTGFNRIGALATQGAFPFDLHREGLVLGEGGAVLVLESVELAKKRDAKIYGQVLGFGVTADGYHVSAPEPGSRGAIAAVKQCLKRSSLSPDEIDYIHAHGTATQLNDRNEAYLLRQLFPKTVPVSSTKGSTGHTIGASGVLGAAFCLMALNQQMLPPNVGLKQSEFNLNLVTSACPATVNHTLCLSFGFGGQNGAIAFGKLEQK